MRIYTTRELQDWFTDLALVEHLLREDIRVYQDLGLTPREAGIRILQHPVMQVTAATKRRFASTSTISQSFDLKVVQTFKFPFSRPADLAVQAEENLQAVRVLVRLLADYPMHGASPSRAFWTDVRPEHVLTFLSRYRVDEACTSVRMDLVAGYIQRAVAAGELHRWTVAVSGRNSADAQLGTVNWEVPGGPVNQISRSRLGLADSVGVITDPGDEAIGFDDLQLADLERRYEAERGRRKSRSVIARQMRDPTDGLLVLYPISRNSGHDLSPNEGVRQALYEDPTDPNCRDLVGFAISFPRSDLRQTAEAYTEGSVPWRPAE
jgi:hypothetical protein